MSQTASHLDPYTEQAERTDITLQEKINGLKDIIHQVKTGMLTTHSPDGQLHARAMTPTSPIAENQLTLVFIANRVSHKCGDLDNDAHVNVSFYDAATTNWASFCGKARISQDRDMVKKHWSKSTSAWFGDMKDDVHHGDANDPRVILIEVIPDEIRYWVATKGAARRAVESGIGSVTGKVSCPGEIRTITKREDVDETGPSIVRRHRKILMTTEDKDEVQISTPDAQLQLRADSHDFRRKIHNPIYAIPPEILSHIFKLGKAMCEDEMEDDKLDDSHSSMPFEILITHVNSRFRKIALNTHYLWSCIRIGTGKSTRKVAAYIQRSGRYKLEVQLNQSHIELDERVKQMVNLILPHSFRWRTFYYTSVYEAQRSPVLSYIADIAAPVLEELSLSIDEMQHPDNSDDPSQQSIFKKGAPNLFFVRLRGFALYSLLPPLSAVRTLHLDQTKGLTLGCPILRRVISTPLRLEHLSVYGDMIASATWPSLGDTLVFPGLKSLRICDVGGRAYAGILLNFGIPALNALALKGVQDHDLERLWLVGNPSKFSNLERLIFWDFGLHEFAWRQTFRLFPGITSFSFYSSKGVTTMLQLLAESNLYAVPWPHLMSLSLIINFEDEEEKSLIRRVIAARRGCGHPLDEVRLGINEEEEGSYFHGSTRIAYFKYLDTWPPNREFRDWDDDLFL
ncbi:hypothetical protein APHAL10511_000180 [Amanita phalloides]|nr:hypothetical protein APHAL10511_000180 [Amanita phalloides]